MSSRILLLEDDPAIAGQLAETVVDVLEPLQIEHIDCEFVATAGGGSYVSRTGASA